jgi:hypothetical protein
VTLPTLPDVGRQAKLRTPNRNDSISQEWNDIAEIPTALPTLVTMPQLMVILSTMSDVG